MMIFLLLIPVLFAQESCPNLERELKVGALTSSVEMVTTYGLYTAKNLKIMGEEVKLNPKFLYKGFWGCALGHIATETQIIALSGYLRDETKRPFLSAGVSGVVGTLFECPFVNVTVNIQKNRLGILESAKKIYNEKGIHGYYHGLLPALVRNTTPAVCILGGGPYLQKRLEDNGYGEHKELIAGTATGIITSALLHPFDVLGVRKQAQLFSKSYVSEVKELVRSQGARSLFRAYPLAALEFVVASCLFQKIDNSF